MFLVSSYSCLCSICWSHEFSREWRCSWSSTDRWCSNYIWVNKFIVYKGASYIIGFKVSLPQQQNSPSSTVIGGVHDGKAVSRSNTPMLGSRRNLVKWLEPCRLQSSSSLLCSDSFLVWAARARKKACGRREELKRLNFDSSYTHKFLHLLSKAFTKSCLFPLP